MTWLDMSVTAIAVAAVVLGMLRANRHAVHKAKFAGACEGVESVSAQLAEQGMDNGWVVGQKPDGSIHVMPYGSDTGHRRNKSN